MTEESSRDGLYREEKLSELEILKQSLDEQKAASDEKILRLSADFDNFRKRTERQKIEYIEFGKNQLIAEIIEIYETVQAASGMVGESENNKAVKDGLGHIEKNIFEILKRHNVIPMETVGARFDPMRHEVIEVVENSGVEEGTIIEEVRAGYMIDDRVLKPAIVKITRHQAADGKAAGEQEVKKENEEGEKKN